MLWGSGMLVMLADCDAGNILVAAQGAACWGWAVILFMALLIAPLFWVQHLSATLGFRSGKSFGKLIYDELGLLWARVMATCLFATVLITITTQLTAVAGIGLMFGFSPSVTTILFATVLSLGSAVDRGKVLQTVILLVGSIEASFLVLGGMSLQKASHTADQTTLLSLVQPGSLSMTLAILAATFNPWMVFYHQHAAAHSPDRSNCSLRLAGMETATGAILVQLLTIAIAVVVSADDIQQGGALENVGDIARAFQHVAGPQLGTALFTAGVMSSATVASVVSARALADGLMELLPADRRRERTPATLLRRSRTTASLYAAGTVVSLSFTHPLGDNLVVQTLGSGFTVVILAVLFTLGVRLRRASNETESSDCPSI